MFNEKGIETIGFEIIVGVTIAFFILLIVLGAINYFEGLRYQVSSQLFVDGLKAAINSPNGKIVEKSNIGLKAGKYSTRFLSLQTGLQEKCLRFKPASSKNVEVSSDSSLVELKQDFTSKVYYRCFTKGFEDSFEPFDCEISCYISIGNAFEESS